MVSIVSYGREPSDGTFSSTNHYALLTFSCRATTTQPPNLMNWNMTGMIQTLTASGGLSYTAGN